MEETKQMCTFISFPLAYLLAYPLGTSLHGAPPVTLMTFHATAQAVPPVSHVLATWRPTGTWQEMRDAPHGAPSRSLQGSTHASQ